MRLKQLGKAAGGRKLGCMMHELPPGKRAWPYHYHLANEEAIYVLAGQGTLRLPSGEVSIAAGDYLAFPIGEAFAHQITNTGSEPLRYLAVSTMVEPDIACFPDSGKLGLFAGQAPGGPADGRTLFRTGRLQDTEYWDEEG